MKYAFLTGLMTLCSGCGSTQSVQSAAEVKSKESTYNESARTANGMEEISKKEAAAELIGTSDTDIAGLWEMTVNSPRGERTNTLTISEKNGVCNGTTENDSFTINKNGKELIWSITLETPIGSMKANYKGIIDGDVMNGTMEMTSGMMAGREMDFTAIRK